VRNRNGPFQGPLFGLAPDGVFRASALALGAVGSYPAFSPLPPIPSQGPGADGGVFSVALSVGMPCDITSRVYPARQLAPVEQVTRHRALWCSDFPPPSAQNGDGSDSPPFQNQEKYTINESVNQ